MELFIYGPCGRDIREGISIQADDEHISGISCVCGRAGHDDGFEVCKTSVSDVVGTRGKVCTDEVEGRIGKGEGSMDAVCEEGGGHWVGSRPMACEVLFEGKQDAAGSGTGGLVEVGMEAGEIWVRSNAEASEGPMRVGAPKKEVVVSEKGACAV